MEDATLEITSEGIVLSGKNGLRAVYTWDALFVVILARVASGLVSHAKPGVPDDEKAE